MRDIHLMEIKQLDSGLWFGKWRLDVGRATLGKCQMRLILLSPCVTSVKKIQALRQAAQTLYFSAHTEKKIRGNIGL